MKKPSFKLIATALGVVLLAATAVILVSGGEPAEQPPSPAVTETVSPVDAAPVVSASDDISDPVYAEDILFDLPCSCVASGHSFIAGIAIAPLDADFSTVVWASSDESVAVVDNSGYITAIAPGKTYITVRSGEVERGQWLTVIQPGLVYLSPSNEFAAAFAYGDTNEQEQMKLIAMHCARRLEQCGVKYHIAADELSYVERAADALALGSDIYVSLQADVISGQSSTTAFYHASSGPSVNLAYRLYDRISAISPSEEDAGLNNGVTANITEINYPFEHGGISSAVIGIESRVRTESARWMVENAETIGWEIANAILDYYAGF